MTESRPDDALTVHQAADVVGVDVRQIRELLAVSRLRGWKTADDRTWRVRRDEAEAYRDGRPRPVRDEITAQLEDYQQRIAVLQEQIDDIMRQRNRALVRWNDAGHSITALARATPTLGRQRLTDLLRVTRAEILAERAAQARDAK